MREWQKIPGSVKVFAKNEPLSEDCKWRWTTCLHFLPQFRGEAKNTLDLNTAILHIWSQTNHESVSAVNHDIFTTSNNKLKPNLLEDLIHLIH